jgi:acetyltransferase-like isoleucine patch superfamily enzyme
MRDLYFWLLRIMKSPSLLLRKVALGKGCRIELSAFISKSRIGKFNYIGHGCVIDRAEIGNYCSIAAYVMIGGAEHPIEWWSTSFRLSRPSPKKLTVIEDDVWIGNKATIKQGIKIGRGAIIGSHAVVLENVPPYAIVVGIPAKVIRFRFDEKQIAKVSFTKFWEMDPSQAQKYLGNLL